MRSIEKVYGKVMELGKMSLETLVVNGSKTAKNDMRRDAYYYNQFKSEKYDNVSELDQLNINYKNYLVLSYKGYDENQNFESDEIWMNGRSLESFKDFLIDAYEKISQNSSKIYGKNKINNDYEDYIIQTGYDENGDGYGTVDSLGHTVFIYPEIFETQDGSASYNGVVLGFENEKGKQFVQEISLITLYSLASIVKEYNPLMEGRLVSIQGMLYQLLNVNNSSNDDDDDSSRKIRKSLTPRSNKVVRKPIQRRKSLSEVMQEEETNTEEENDDINDSEEEVIEKKTIKKSSPSKKKVEAKETNKISLNDIIAESDNIAIDLMDEDEEY